MGGCDISRGAEASVRHTSPWPLVELLDSDGGCLVEELRNTEGFKRRREL